MGSLLTVAGEPEGGGTTPRGAGPPDPGDPELMETPEPELPVGGPELGTPGGTPASLLTLPGEWLG